METVNECPVCSSTQFSPFLVCKDYLVSQESFAIQQCNACEFRFTNPRPDNTTIGSYYESEQYISHNDESNGVISVAYRTVRKYTLRSKLQLVNKLHQGTGRILDVGCGTGTFLETCKKGGWSIMGVEPDRDARAISTEKLQVAVEANLSALIGAGSFDIISLWHVLEHMPSLSQTIPQLYELLTGAGTLLIAVPNSDSYDATYFKEYWAAYDVPRHLHHFTPSTIEPLFGQYGFRLIEQRLMPFDALYIAMLSTRYKTGWTDYVESIRVGLTSNIKAKQTGNSSSLTYLFKKA